MGEEMMEEDMEKQKKQKKPGNRRRLSGSTAAKVTAFFLLLIASVVGVGSGICAYYMAEEGYYEKDYTEVLEQNLSGHAATIACEVSEMLQSDEEYIISDYLEDMNARVSVRLEKDRYSKSEDVILWSSAAEGDSFDGCGVEVDVPVRMEGKYGFDQAETYLFRVEFDSDFVQNRTYSGIVRETRILYNLRYYIYGILGGSVLVWLLCLIFLLCSAGHKNGRECITPDVFGGMYFDVFTLLCLALVGGGGMLTEQLMWPLGDYGVIVVAAAALVLLEALVVFWLTEFAIRLKMGQWWKKTLLYVILTSIGRAFGTIGKVLWKGICGVPTILITLIAFLVICIVEFAGILTWCEAEFFILWLLVKLVLLPVLVYIALVCKKLLAASEAMAAGEEGYVVDTSHMFGQFREHGENLNQLSQGISKAVAARLRSEHLKTELITNVSHDLKTPLTSIINYADLISAEETDNPKIAEYSQVLLRQSERLKKLLEDLLEASKATTGNLEVDLKPCEAGVLLTQAVGEYQQRMEEKHLELKTAQPQEPVVIMADGRHLWRVFDNLLNNICKYAQENSRVYVSVEKREKRALIIFRNMSKYALDITGEELEERFVRGDKSRHMEGSGLGLSIAKSLTELQNGTLNIVIDGDLFKVILEFEALE